MAAVFRFKHFAPAFPKKKSDPSSNEASEGKKQPRATEKDSNPSSGAETCSNPDSPNFDWGLHQDFLFINTDRHTLKTKRDRNVVRAHVMNDLNKKERFKKKFRSYSTSNVSQLQLQPRRRHPLRSSPAAIASPARNVSKEFLKSSGLYHSARSSIPSTPSIGSTDPFKSLPLVMTKHVETWFNFWIKIQGPGLVPLEANELCNPILSLFAPLILSDAAAMHALLCMAGLQYTRLQYSTIHASNSHSAEIRNIDTKAAKSPPLYLLHKRHALADIQKRLTDPAQAISDGTIAAVLLLAGYEFMSRDEGHLIEYQHHMNGLSTLVKLRGGLDRLGLKGFLQQLVSWVDLWGASSTSSPLKFHLPSHLLSFHNPICKPPTAHRLGQGFAALSTNNHFQKSTKEILSDVSKISPLYSHYKHHKASQEELILLVGERTSLEQRLVSLTGPKEIADFPLSSDLLHDLCRVAALLFINRSLRITETVSVRTTELMGELFSRLPSAMVAFNCDVGKNILLWTIFVGGTAALEGGQRKWFVERLAYMRRSAGLSRWQDAKSFLENYLWSEAHCALSYEAFWNESIGSEVSNVVSEPLL